MARLKGNDHRLSWATDHPSAHTSALWTDVPFSLVSPAASGIATVCEWGGLQDGGPADPSYILVGLSDDLECSL